MLSFFKTVMRKAKGKTTPFCPTAHGNARGRTPPESSSVKPFGGSQAMKYRIHVYVVCWNEMDILPFCVDYWKRYAEKVVVYDNGSTDGSLEFMS